MCRHRWTRASSLAALLGALALMVGCRSVGPHTSHCLPQVGMDTDQLALCGCVSADTAGGYQAPLSPSSPRGPVTRISVVNYICPFGSAGIAKVVVANGIAREVFY